MLSPSECHVSSLISGYLGDEICLFESVSEENILGVKFNSSFFIGFNNPLELLKFGFSKGFNVVLARETGKIFIGENRLGEEVRAVFSGLPSLRPKFYPSYNVGAYLFLDENEQLFIQAGSKTFECQLIGEELLIMEETEEVLQVTVILGTLEMTISELLALRPGGSIELPEEAILAIGGVQIAKGKVLDGKFKISRLTTKLYHTNSDKNLQMEVI